jgi:Fe-Mn family superoxide dismutase
MSLAGGSGWCVLTYNTYTNELRNQWAWDHMHGAIAALPLLLANAALLSTTSIRHGRH